MTASDEQIDDMARRVEERIWSRIARWVMLNVVAIIVAIGGGITAYYDVKHDIRAEREHGAVLDAQQVAQDSEARYAREQVYGKLENISNRIDEINRFLRDSHTSNYPVKHNDVR